MFEMLDDMLELIYIADVETYELLFVNTAGRETFNIQKLDGCKCYKTLQGLDEPCSFCTTKFLTQDDVYSWEFTNKVTGYHYLLKDRLINWKGRRARIEIAIDATELENERTSLQFSIDTEKMVMDCAKELYKTSDIIKTINNVLVHVGKFLSAERAYIFDICNDKMFNTYEWCAEGVQPQKDNLQNLDISLIDGWMPQFRERECVIYEDLDDVCKKYPQTYNILNDQGISSLIVAPLERNGQLVGYLGVDNPPAEKIHNIGSIFNTLGFFLMTSIRRVEDEKRLEALSYCDTLTGFYNRNRFMKDAAAMGNYKDSLGLVYLDINGLKDINDLHGHARGDEMLTICASNISEHFKGYDYYRIGGDEFVVVCKNIEKEKFDEQVEDLKKTLDSDKGIRAAVGSKWVEHLEDIQYLLSQADDLMYEDKRKFYKDNPASNRYRQWQGVQI